MSTPTTFREVAAKLAANGYRPVPIMPGTKKPAVDDWPNFAFAPGCERHYAQDGAGVLTGEVVAIDIDVDDADAVSACENIVYEVVGLSDAAVLPRRIGKAPRLLLLLRTSVPFTKIMTAPFRMRSCPDAEKHSKVEVLAAGQQFVAFAIHKDTHRPYEWNGGGSILTIPREELPAITEAQARQIIAACDAALNEWGDRVEEAKAEGEAGHRQAGLAAPLLEKLDSVRTTSKGWVACCPAHDDREPSLAIRELDDRVLVHCHAGCKPEAIVRAVGLTMDALFRKAKKAPEPDPAKRNDHVIVGGALTLALGMDDLEFVCAPILTKGQKGTLTAHPGHGKSTFGAGLCVAHALHRMFGPISPEADGLAYFVSVEDMYGTRNKFLGEAARLKLDAAERAQLDARLRWVQVETSATPSLIKEAVEHDAAGQSVALVFIDTGPALFSGDDENDNVALRNFVEGFAQMADLPGKPATVLAWHPTKSATADRLEPRGASAIKAVCDFCLTLWKDEDQVTLGYTKVRAQHFDPIEGRLSTVELVAASGTHYFAPVITLDVEERAERSDVKEAREAILKRMYATRTVPATVRELSSAIGISKTAIGRYLQHFITVRPQLATKDAIDDRYALTKAGEERAKLLIEREKNAYNHRRDPD